MRGAAAKYTCPIGTPGKPWGDDERAQWLAKVGTVKRSYEEEVLKQLEPLKEHFDVEQFGALSRDPARYPLYAVRTRGWDPSKPSVLVTGGVHGYETSGVQGALCFLREKAQDYSRTFNILVAPCVSPWAYECIQRWDYNAVDPNRNFCADSGVEQCAALMKLLAPSGVEQEWMCHVDLHETTDTDMTEFSPAKAARDGAPFEDDVVPDGFYLVGNREKPQPAWHAAIIARVKEVTHSIA
jgi:hypothetical protein